MNLIFDDIGVFSLFILIFVSFLTSMVHGATGIAGGFLLAAVAAPVLGLQSLVPVLSITLLISHSARAILNFTQIDWQAYFRLVIPAVPFIIAASLIYGRLSSASIALLLGTIVLSSIPIRRWAKSSDIRTTNPMLTVAGCIYGAISGVSIGPGMLLMPVLLGYGLNRQAFVATLAAIALTTNVVRGTVYGLSDLLNSQTVLLGILLGLATIPGTWIGRGVLRRLTDAKHIVLVEWLLVLGGLNFFWMAYRYMNAG